jgi:hypothetical protein
MRGCLFAGLKHDAAFAQLAAINGGFASRAAAPPTRRRESFNPNSGLPTAASAFSRKRLANSPQCSAAGVIFA